MASIEERVRDLVVEQLGVSQEQVNPQASFIDDLGADSLDTVELVMAFEDEFGIDIPDEDAERIMVVDDAIKYLEENSDQKENSDQEEKDDEIKHLEENSDQKENSNQEENSKA